ncbi:PQQ-binding-like beta-propeller repeat protein [Longimicrobium sp.]|uniref:PQQ-binding-like beta-propeller repeat protein n=1 Tax=Longimicrobium sp. TaxID=2029185 RepID=UPI003B3B19FE
MTAILLTACDEPLGGGGEMHGIGGVDLMFRVAVSRADNAFVPVSDGMRLYADVDRRVEAFDLNTGAKLWSYTRPPGGPSSMVARDGRLFWAGDSAVALDAATGRELWRQGLDSPAGLGESDGDADAYYVGTREHRVYAFRATDGALLWTRDLGPDWPLGGVVRGMTVSGDTVYAAVEHNTGVNGYLGTGDVFALNRRTGAVHWVHRNGDGSGLDIYQSAGRVSGRLLLLSANWANEYVALDRLTGQEAWRARGEFPFAGMDEAPEVRENRAYFASHDLYARAVDLGTGREIWRTRVASGANKVAPCGKRLLVQHLGLSVLDLETGKMLGHGYGGEVNEYLHTDYVVVGNRAYVFGQRDLYGFRCPE